MVLTVGLAAAIRMSGRWIKVEAARREAEKSRTEAELKNLRNQLNPHFLLNTLNNIYALIAFDSDKAQAAVQELSRLLRHVLYDNQQNFVALGKEMDFIRNYIELMRIRLASNVTVETQIDVRADSRTEIAPLIFISLIENAFKHGISPTESSFIRIHFSESPGQVCCEITNIPLKVNTAGVIPVIFAQSLMSFPVVIASFFNVDYSSFGGKILRGLSQGNWCDPNAPIYSIGLIVYIALIVFFAYFYTSITFNPYEVARNLQKSGATIGGITPGKPTAEYLTRILNYIIFIGAVGLTIISVIPIFFSGVFNADVSFGGTSIIIIVGVVLETIRQIEALMVVRKPSRIF